MTRINRTEVVFLNFFSRQRRVGKKIMFLNFLTRPFIFQLSKKTKLLFRKYKNLYFIHLTLPRIEISL
jgi:hypothetical protein